MKTFLYQAPTADRGEMRLELGSFNICKDTNISKIFTINIIKKKDVTLKKTGKVKIYITAHRKIYSKPIRQLLQEFKENFDFTCLLSTFYKYKPFYIGPLTDREKRIMPLF